MVSISKSSSRLRVGVEQRTVVVAAGVARRQQSLATVAQDKITNIVTRDKKPAIVSKS